MTISRFHVTDMDCAAEEQLVRLALSDLDGINRIEFNLEQRDVVIDHETDPDIIDSVLQTLNLGTSHVDNTSVIGPAADTRRERRALIGRNHPTRRPVSSAEPDALFATIT